MEERLLSAEAAVVLLRVCMPQAEPLPLPRAKQHHIIITLLLQKYQHHH